MGLSGSGGVGKLDSLMLELPARERRQSRQFPLSLHKSLDPMSLISEPLIASRFLSSPWEATARCF